MLSLATWAMIVSKSSDSISPILCVRHLYRILDKAILFICAQNTVLYTQMYTNQLLS